MMLSSEDSDGSGDEMDTRKMVMAQNRKKKKSGGFQAMGLSHAVFKGIIRKGYKIPTPIQRKTIPVLMEGKDVVAMARTGSGKTAAFLIPMLEKLQKHSASGARALILSPTRELALQTLKFTKELGRFTGLHAAAILGGDKMEDQFSALHENPDIIIATPGRLLHVLVEMNKSLKEVQYVVFDEADRLFEMGFAEQLKEILHRIPESRQTLLFSATLPKTLVSFARAGLSDPTLIRLDVETKLSIQLKMSFLSCRTESKPAMLLYLLRSIIDTKEQTVVFAATKHHVEYLHALLTKCGISSTYIYSSLDQTARKINFAKFRQRQTMVMVVTDLAARGMDIPLLDNVINFNFPAKPKLFVHRVGRVARAGRSGSAYSLVASDELAYLVDLHVFLGRPLKLVPSDKKIEDKDGYFGDIPQHLIDDQADELMTVHKESVDLQNMRRVSENAYKQYIRSRPTPAVESVKRAKQLEKDGIILGPHPICKDFEDGAEERLKVLSALKNYKASATIFEINATAKKQAHLIMKQKRDLHGHIVNSTRQRKAELVHEEETPIVAASDNDDEDDLQGVFSRKAEQSKNVRTEPKKKKMVSAQDSEHYLPYQPADYQSEAGYSIVGGFNSEITSAVLDFTGDDEQNMSLNHARKWDRKRKKFVVDGREGKVKKIKTESGNWIPASYKSDLYNTWRDKQKLAEQDDRDDDDHGDEDNNAAKKHKRRKAGFQVSGTRGRKRHTKGMQNPTDEPPGSKKHKFKGRKQSFRGGKHELKSSDQILKERRRKSRMQAFQKRRHIVKAKRRENKKRNV